MNEYRGRHAPSQPWAVASTASVRRGRHQRRNPRRRIRFILLAILLLALLAYPFIESKILTVDKKLVASKDLPSDANHLRIVYVSDIHWGFWYSDADLGGLLSRINSLRPDLVLFGGDYATDNASAIQFFQHLQSQLKIHTRYGIYGVLGENDVGETAFDRQRLTEAMIAAEVTPLVNQTVPVYIGSGSKILIAGLDDAIAGKPAIKSVASSVSGSDYVILLCHNPSVIPEAQRATDSSGSLGWFDLGLFGHTHGGQMMFFSSLLDIAGDVPDGYRSGWLRENRSELLVSRGVGTSVIPFRLGCYPQIHLIELTTSD